MKIFFNYFSSLCVNYSVHYNLLHYFLIKLSLFSLNELNHLFSHNIRLEIKFATKRNVNISL